MRFVQCSSEPGLENDLTRIAPIGTGGLITIFRGLSTEHTEYTERNLREATMSGIDDSKGINRRMALARGAAAALSASWLFHEAPTAGGDADSEPAATD